VRECAVSEDVNIHLVLVRGHAAAHVKLPPAAWTRAASRCE